MAGQRQVPGAVVQVECRLESPEQRRQRAVVGQEADDVTHWRVDADVRPHDVDRRLQRADYGR